MDQNFAAAEVVERCWVAWAARDRLAFLQFMDDDVQLAIYVPEDVVPFGGVTSGKPSVSDRLQTILDVFETRWFRGDIVKVIDGVVHGRVEFCFRHKITGEELEGVIREVITVRAGLVTSWLEYLDAERVKAFMRLVAYAAAP